MSWYTSWTPSDSKSRIDDSWSPSRSVSSFFNFGDVSYVPTTYSTGDKTKEELSSILAELNRSANMLSNASADGVEQNIRVRYVKKSGDDGKPKVEGFDAKNFVITPDLMLDSSGTIISGDSYYNNLDALHGRVILGTQIRKNITKADFDLFASSDDIHAKQTYQSLQEAIAYNQISQDWVGFQPYLKKHSEITHSKKSEFAVPQELTADEFESIINAANFNMLNPDDPIVSPNDEVNNIVNEFNEKLGTNWQSAIDTVNWLKELLNVKPPPAAGSGAGEDDDEDEGDDEGEDAGGDGDGGSDSEKSDPKSIDADGRPKPMDAELLSDKPIESKKDYGDLTGTEADMLEINDLRVRERDAKWMAERYNRTAKTAEENYKHFVKQNASKIKEIEKCFLFQENVCSVYSHGLPSGELDEHAFAKICRGDYEGIYERKDTPKQSKYCLGILLDQSGSMRSGRIVQARQVVMLLLEGLKAYTSITPIVYGHSGQESSHRDVDLLPYVSIKDNNRHFLSVAPALLQNIDGMAINHVAKQMKKVPDIDRSFMLVISDGQPEGYGYSGSAARRHTRRAVDAAAKAGIKVFGIGICGAFDDETGKGLYGAGNFVVINDVEGSLKVMTKKLKSFLSQN